MLTRRSERERDRGNISNNRENGNNIFLSDPPTATEPEQLNNK